jgi:hypothetical protein
VKVWSLAHVQMVFDNHALMSPHEGVRHLRRDKATPLFFRGRALEQHAGLRRD